MRIPQIQAAITKGQTRFVVLRQGAACRVETFKGAMLPKGLDGEVVGQGSCHFDADGVLILSPKNAADARALTQCKKALRISLRGPVEIGEEPIYNTLSDVRDAAAAAGGDSEEPIYHTLNEVREAAGAGAAAADDNDEPIYNTTEPIRQAAAAAAADAEAGISDDQIAFLHRAKAKLPIMLKTFHSAKESDDSQRAKKIIVELHRMIQKPVEAFSEAEFRRFVELIKAIQALLPKPDANPDPDA